MRVEILIEQKYHGARHSPGSVVDVPDDVAAAWLRRGYATTVTGAVPSSSPRTVAPEVSALLDAVPGLTEPAAAALVTVGFVAPEGLALATDNELAAIKGVGKKSIDAIRQVAPHQEPKQTNDESKDAE